MYTFIHCQEEEILYIKELSDVKEDESQDMANIGDVNSLPFFACYSLTFPDQNSTLLSMDVCKLNMLLCEDDIETCLHLLFSQLLEEFQVFFPCLVFLLLWFFSSNLNLDLIRYARCFRFHLHSH